MLYKYDYIIHLYIVKIYLLHCRYSVRRMSVKRKVAYYLYSTPFFASLWKRDSFHFGFKFFVIQINDNERKELVNLCFSNGSVK